MKAKTPAVRGAGTVADDHVPFNVLAVGEAELRYAAEALASGHLSGDGSFSRRCSVWLEETLRSPRALLTHSCTAALEMAALLLDIRPGDEVIMPSFTFVSTANAFVLRGGVPVFVDIRSDTLNIDERQIEAAITPRTRALVPVHYAGVACDMDPILALADRHGLSVVEDAAQGLLSSYKGRALGSIGSLGALSFHQTKNVIAGEGGALIINDPALIARAEVIREKGTNRGQFLKGEVSEYTWTDVGSSFLPSELVAAVLYAQLERAARITQARRAIWRRYHEMLEALEREGLLRRPFVPDGCEHNGHIYYVILRTGSPDRARARLREAGVQSPSHYVPLHSSPVGRRVGRAAGDLPVTDDVAGHLVRLPLWIGLTQAQQAHVVSALRKALTG